jgi:hypothetical protein
MGRLLRAACVLAVCAALMECPFSGATEKRWIAHEAQVIVVGRFKPSPTWLWFDGWHINGVITVDEVLYGREMPRQLNFQFVCKWDNYCQRWPPPHYPAFTLQQGLWFLRRIHQNTWESADGFSDTGFRYLSNRAYWEDYIRHYKR